MEMVFRLVRPISNGALLCRRYATVYRANVSNAALQFLSMCPAYKCIWLSQIPRAANRLIPVTYGGRRKCREFVAQQGRCCRDRHTDRFFDCVEGCADWELHDLRMRALCLNHIDLYALARPRFGLRIVINQEVLRRRCFPISAVLMLPTEKWLHFHDLIQYFLQLRQSIETDDIDIDRQPFGRCEVEQQAGATLENEI